MGSWGARGGRKGPKRRKDRGEKDVVWVQACAESWEFRRTD